MPNHNYLVPWDIVIDKNLISDLNDKQNSIRKSQLSSSKKKNEAESSSSVTARAYIGMEYECPCGHRFICSGPDKIVRVSTNGNVKVNMTIKDNF